VKHLNIDDLVSGSVTPIDDKIFGRIEEAIVEASKRNANGVTSAVYLGALEFRSLCALAEKYGVPWLKPHMYNPSANELTRREFRGHKIYCVDAASHCAVI
jgi:hypothetical protein